MPLSTRRLMHRLILFYKMKNNLTPGYLSSLIPQAAEESRYNTRNPLDVRIPRCRTQFYSKSFFPSTVHSWNHLPAEIRQSDSLPIFKSRILNFLGKTSVPLHFYHGDRPLNIQHSRLRTHCSNLKEHLYSKNIIPDPFCSCGEIETTAHFLLECPNFDGHRVILFAKVQAFTSVTVDKLLFGDASLSEQSNIEICNAVHHFISTSHRFN